MKAGRTSPLSRFLAVVLCGGLLAIPCLTPCVARAANTGSIALHEWTGLVTASSETDFTGTGNVVLAASVINGVTRGWIDVSVFNYPQGAYSVSVVTVSSSSTVVLGGLNVQGLRGPLKGQTFGRTRFGYKRPPFPPGFNPFDVASVSVSDSNGNVVSSATLSPIPDGYLTALSPLTPGATAPRAGGYALIRANGAEPAPPLVISGGLGGVGGAGTTTFTGGGGTITLGGLSYGGISTGTIVDGGTLTVAGGLGDGGTLTIGSGATLYTNPSNPILGDGGATITIYTGTVGTPVITSSTGTLALSGSGVFAGAPIITSGPIVSGTPVLTGTLCIDGSGPYDINGGTFVTGTDGGIVITGSTPSGGTLILTGSCITSGTFSIISTPSDMVDSARPVRTSRARTAEATPVTGSIVIHAHGLPASATLSYFADGTLLGTGTTDSMGRLSVTATQGGSGGTLPSTLDLYSIQAITVQDSSGDTLLTAQF